MTTAVNSYLVEYIRNNEESASCEVVGYVLLGQLDMYDWYSIMGVLEMPDSMALWHVWLLSILILIWGDGG